MSASLFYRFTDKKNPTLPVLAPSSFIEVMTDAFGEPPFHLSSSDAAMIRGIRAGCRQANREAFDKILELIEDGREIEIWSEW